MEIHECTCICKRAALERNQSDMSYGVLYIKPKRIDIDLSLLFLYNLYLAIYCYNYIYKSKTHVKMHIVLTYVCIKTYLNVIHKIQHSALFILDFFNFITMHFFFKL